MSLAGVVSSPRDRRLFGLLERFGPRNGDKAETATDGAVAIFDS